MKGSTLWWVLAVLMGVSICLQFGHSIGMRHGEELAWKCWEFRKMNPPMDVRCNQLHEWLKEVNVEESELRTSIKDQAMKLPEPWQPMKTAPLDRPIVVAYRGPHADKYVAMAFFYNEEWVIAFNVERIRPYAWAEPLTPP